MLTKPLRLLFLLGSRGEWGYIRPVIKEATQRGHKAVICATNMSLLSSHGALADEVEAAGFDVRYRILNSVDGGTRDAMAKSIGLLGISFVDVLGQERPDWVVLAGDRAEQMAAATACAYTYTPAAHIQAGERSGNIDGVARHAIGRLVHVHFAANEDAAVRLVRSGEEPWRVKLTGAPQLDDIISSELPTSADPAYGHIKPSEQFVLACFHPVTEQIAEVEAQVRVTLEALARFDLPVVWILPNNDAGGGRVRDEILRGISARDRAFANLPRPQYLGLMRDCLVLIGNSSSGLLEAPTFGTPAVNIGRRQADRIQGANVVNAEPTTESIVVSLQLALESHFRELLSGKPNPYGDGRSSPRIVDVLESVPRDEKLFHKQITF